MFVETPAPESHHPTGDSSPKRVAIVIGTLETGGAGRMALTLLRELLATGHDARLFCLGSDIHMPIPGAGQEQERIRHAITSLGRGTAKQNTLKKALAFPLLHRRLEQAIRAHQSQRVISFMERANILSLLGSNRVPRIISIRKHFGMALAAKSPLKRFLVLLGYRALLRRASNINFNSSEAADNFRGFFPNLKVPISVINNFLAPDLLSLAAESPGEGAKSLLSEESIVTTGRLLPVKGHTSLIRAFSKVAEQRPEAKLLILGEGPLKGELKALIHDLGLQERVFLPGFQSNPYAWVARGKLFVLSSHSEGFPNALLEAMGLGRPVISTDCHSGPRELLAPDSEPDQKTETVDKVPFGILTPQLEQKSPPDLADTARLSASEQALTDAMLDLLNSPSQTDHYAQQASDRSKEFTKEAIMQQWINIVHSH